jgi:hypothetical protein
MRQRCANPRDKAWPNYGGRGITVDPRWDSFAVFIADLGPSPSPKHSLERVDNNLGYGPTNCVWATRTVQNRNSRHNRLLTIGGKTRTVAEWAETTGTPRSVIYNRLWRGWSEQDAVFRR